MKKIDNFTNVYKVQKTLRFKLIPVGKTEENFNNTKMLEKDEIRLENYQCAKKIIDRYFNYFIGKTLSEIKRKSFNADIKEFSKLYYKTNKEEDEKKKLNEELPTILQKEIEKCFTSNENFNDLFKGKILEKIIKSNILSEEEYEIIASFDKFSTYFTNYLINRKNIFMGDGKVGSIPYRCIKENLPMFLNNARIFNEIKNNFREELKQLNDVIKRINYGCKVEDVFNVDYYSLCLTGDDISVYNTIIGGITLESGEKIQGINEYINLYNQKNRTKMPRLKQLYKQILQEGEKFSFSIDKFKEDIEVYNAINIFLNNKEYKIDKLFDNIVESIKKLKEDDLKNIYINCKNINAISSNIYGNWNIIINAFKNEYDCRNVKDIGKKKYEEDKEKYFKKKLAYSVSDIITFVGKYNNDIKKDFCIEMLSIFEKLYNQYLENNGEYLKIRLSENKIRENKNNIEIIKNLLDSIKEFYDLTEMFFVNDLDIQFDDNFYAEIGEIRKIDGIVDLYNMVRNYVTTKPYSLEKIKLNFNNPTFLNGWDVNKECDNDGVILLKDGNYYLAIMQNGKNKIFKEAPVVQNNKNCYMKMNYKLIANPSRDLPHKYIRFKKNAMNKNAYSLSNEPLIYYDKGCYKKGENFNINDMHKLIDYFKNSFIEDNSNELYNFKFKNTSVYKDISQFYREVEHQGYMINYSNIPVEYINEKINNGELFLFQIYNKDFSKYSKGMKNLHTLYFEQVFDKDNLKDVVYKLNGEAEMFYRKKSIEYKITHPKNEPIENKNVLNNKKTSVFKYDLIKNKRFAINQFEFHVPITINFKAENYLMNQSVNESVKECKDNFIIGIDRGERNLIYIVVINEKGEIVEQISLNSILNIYKEQEYVTDYHNLLDKREKERDANRRSWNTVENIKELKEGYVSQVVHKICELVEKYDAIIVMEDLNSGFKNNRIKVEKQVYQKFEKMLIDKLNLYINKNKKANELGGLRNGYQLTNKYKGNAKMSFQNGFIYYIAPWNTSKIDPTTGFVNLFRFSNYDTMVKRKNLFENMDKILYNDKEGYFEFVFNYDNFSTLDHKKKWTVCSCGKRLSQYRNSEKNNNWDIKEVELTKELKNLFEKYNIDIANKDIKNAIISQNEKKFFDELFYLFKLILQMRNSRNDTDEDYIISPVKNNKGEFFDSRKNDEKLPKDADANGAYNIARKGLMIVKRIKEGQEKKLTVITNAEWLKFAQENV